MSQNANVNPVTGFTCNIAIPLAACKRPVPEKTMKLVKLIHTGLQLADYKHPAIDNVLPVTRALYIPRRATEISLAIGKVRVAHEPGSLLGRLRKKLRGNNAQARRVAEAQEQCLGATSTLAALSSSR